LRQRREDIPVIARHLIDVIGLSEARPPVAFTETALVLLSALDWHDNLRELRSLIVRLLTSHAREHTIRLDDVLAEVPLGAGPVAMPPGSLRDARLRFEREYIAGVLQHHGWRMSEAARTLGIQRPNLYRKTRQLGIALLKPVDPAGSR
jgi:DNA-binding NtrC family response regulator